MKTNTNIGLLVAVLLILLLTFFFNVATLVDISKATSNESVIYSALLDAGFYNGVKLIIIGFIIYVVIKMIYKDLCKVREHNDISEFQANDKVSVNERMYQPLSTDNVFKADDVHRKVGDLEFERK